MDRQKRELFLYGIKEDIETKMARKVVNIYEYIKLRHKVRYRIDIVALLGICENCKSVLPRVVNLLWYFVKVYCIPQTMIRAVCPKCKKGSIIFPQL
jgi:RNase P subunit RPR2